jgi:hypothetical protein
MDSSAFFTLARQHPPPQKHPDKVISLYLDDIIAERKKTMAEDASGATDPARNTPPFTIGSPISEDRKKEMQEDPYLAIAYQLIAPLSN